MEMIENLIIDENNIAYNNALGTSYKLNETGKDILEYLKKGLSKDEILNEIVSKYDIDKKEAFIDIQDFFIKLKLYGLVS